jgi:hypothetical protein
VRDQMNGKRVLEMTVHENLIDFSCGRLVNGEVDIRPIGQ